MQIINLRRVVALFSYVACLAAAPAFSQVGPIQPVLITDGKVEVAHNRPNPDEDYSVPVHAMDRGLPHLQVEFRQDLIATAADARRWAEVLLAALPLAGSQAP